MGGQSYDPERWPYAPGNASPDIEAVFQAEQARWPEPSAELRQRVSAIARRDTHSSQATA